MKKLMIGLALTAMATPSLAAGQYHRGMASDPGADAYAYASEPGYFAPVPGAVYVNGEYQGADPDPQIRLQLPRDPPTLKQ